MDSWEPLTLVKEYKSKLCYGSVALDGRGEMRSQQRNLGPSSLGSSSRGNSSPKSGTDQGQCSPEKCRVSIQSSRVHMGASIGVMGVGVDGMTEA